MYIFFPARWHHFNMFNAQRVSWETDPLDSFFLFCIFISFYSVLILFDNELYMFCANKLWTCRSYWSEKRFFYFAKKTLTLVGPAPTFTPYQLYIRELWCLYVKDTKVIDQTYFFPIFSHDFDLGWTCIKPNPNLSLYLCFSHLSISLVSVCQRKLKSLTGQVFLKDNDLGWTRTKHIPNLPLYTSNTSLKFGLVSLGQRKLKLFKGHFFN